MESIRSTRWWRSSRTTVSSAAARFRATTPAAYFTRGGTTGTPNSCGTRTNQVYQAWACNLLLKGKPGTSLLFGMPLFHVGGSLTQALSTLSGGGNLVILSPAGWRNPAAMRNLWALAALSPTALSSVPTILAASLAVPVGDFDLSSIEFIGGGGSAIPVAVGSALTEKHKVPIVEVYGMTETSSVHTLVYTDRPIRLGSVGHPVPYARVRVVKIDSDGISPRGLQAGRDRRRGHGGAGRFRRLSQSRNTTGRFVEPGWVNSGDLGLDEEGYLWITGRAKDLVIAAATTSIRRRWKTCCSSIRRWGSPRSSGSPTPMPANCRSPMCS